MNGKVGNRYTDTAKVLENIFCKAKYKWEKKYIRVILKEDEKKFFLMEEDEFPSFFRRVERPLYVRWTSHGAHRGKWAALLLFSGNPWPQRIG